MNSIKQVTNKIVEQGMLPLFFNADETVSVEILRVLYRSGIRVFEYTNRGEAALKNFTKMVAVRNSNLVGDPIRLNQILINLMGNAVKFTENGKILLDVKLLDQKDNICKIRMKIKDSGIGIPENKFQSIFESFEQAENNKRRYEGTGLG